MCAIGLGVGAGRCYRAVDVDVLNDGAHVIIGIRLNESNRALIVDARKLGSEVSDTFMGDFDIVDSDVFHRATGCDVDYLGTACGEYHIAA